MVALCVEETAKIFLTLWLQPTRVATEVFRNVPKRAWHSNDSKRADSERFGYTSEHFVSPDLRLGAALYCWGVTVIVFGPSTVIMRFYLVV